MVNYLKSMEGRSGDDSKAEWLAGRPGFVMKMAHVVEWAANCLMLGEIG